MTVIWKDDAVTRSTYQHVETEWFETVPEWQRLQLDSLAESGACFVFVEGADPEALKGIDPAKPAAASKARNTQCRSFRHGLDFNTNPWCIAGAPVAAWARQVFPGVPKEVAVYKLWCAILSTARADGADPESDWELHDATFEKNLRLLNERHYDALRYTAGNGTDLTVGLTDRHLWAGGKCETPEGHPFFPNIPTEEVFTSPDCERVDGIVYSAMPLIHNGNKIDRFWLRFEAALSSTMRPSAATPWRASSTRMRAPAAWARSPSSRRTLRSDRAASSSTTRSTTRTRAATSRSASVSRNATRGVTI